MSPYVVYGVSSKFNGALHLQDSHITSIPHTRYIYLSRIDFRNQLFKNSSIFISNSPYFRYIASVAAEQHQLRFILPTGTGEGKNTILFLLPLSSIAEELIGKQKGEELLSSAEGTASRLRLIWSIKKKKMKEPRHF